MDKSSLKIVSVSSASLFVFHRRMKVFFESLSITIPVPELCIFIDYLDQLE